MPIGRHWLHIHFPKLHKTNVNNSQFSKDQIFITHQIIYVRIFFENLNVNQIDFQQRNSVNYMSLYMFRVKCFSSSKLSENFPQNLMFYSKSKFAWNNWLSIFTQKILNGFRDFSSEKFFLYSTDNNGI